VGVVLDDANLDVLAADDGNEVRLAAHVDVYVEICTLTITALVEDAFMLGVTAAS